MGETWLNAIIAREKQDAAKTETAESLPLAARDAGDGQGFDPSRLSSIAAEMTGDITGAHGSGGGSSATGKGFVGGAGQTGQVPIQASLQGGESGPAESSGLFSNRSPVHIAPVGVNLGAILAPFQEGSPENGGYGLNLTSRFLDGMFQSQLGATTVHQEKSNDYTFVTILAVAVGLYVLLRGTL